MFRRSFTDSLPRRQPTGPVVKITCAHGLIVQQVAQRTTASRTLTDYRVDDWFSQAIRPDLSTRLLAVCECPTADNAGGVNDALSRACAAFPGSLDDHSVMIVPAGEAQVQYLTLEINGLPDCEAASLYQQLQGVLVNETAAPGPIWRVSAFVCYFVKPGRTHA